MVKKLLGKIRHKMFESGLKTGDVAKHFTWSIQYTSELLNGKRYVSIEQMNKVYKSLTQISKTKTQSEAA